MTLALPATNNATHPTPDLSTPRRHERLHLSAPRGTRHEAVVQGMADTYATLHTQTARRLAASVREYVRELRRHGEQHAQEVQRLFVHRHTLLLRDAYDAGHRSGQRTYWGSVSAKRSHPLVSPDPTPRTQRLAFYTPSVARMAQEGLAAYRTQQSGLTALSARETGILLAGTGAGGEGDPLGAWQDGLGARLELQAEVTWAGLNGGYLDAAGGDVATPYDELWWHLSAVKTGHCADCPTIAALSPYDPPWVLGGNVLNAMPGDGTTECGGGCKCYLTFEPPRESDRIEAQWAALHSFYQRNPDAWTHLFESASPEQQAQLTRAAADGVADAQPSVPLSDEQKRALDYYRRNWLLWEGERGSLAPLPKLMDAQQADTFIGQLPSWEALSPRQQQLLDAVAEALAAWGDATRMAATVLPWDSGKSPELLAAQDEMRSAYRAYNDVRGQFEALPLLAGQILDIEDARQYGRAHWDSMTLAQQEAFARLWEAMNAYADIAEGAANPDNTTLAEGDDGAILLYNHNHGAGGRFAPGSEGSVHGGGAVHEHVSAERGAGSGGGGSSSGGHAHDQQRIHAAEQELHTARAEHAARGADRQRAEAAHSQAYAEVAHFTQHAYGTVEHLQAVDAFRDASRDLQHARDQEAFALRRVTAAEAHLDVLHGGSGMHVTYHDTALRTGQEAVHSVFGRDLSEHELFALSGAGVGDRVNVNALTRGFEVEVHGAQIQRTFHVYTDHRSGAIVLHDDFTRNNAEHDAQSGLQIIRGMQAAQRLGIDRIEANAARSPRLNGYATWPKLGFDGPIPQSSRRINGHVTTILAAARAEYGQHITRVSEILAHKGGYAWWKEHGDSFDATFHFRDGSYSRRVFDRMVARLERSGHLDSSGT